MKNLIKNNSKFVIIMILVILFGTVGVTYSLMIGNFREIGINTTTANIDANISYDAGSNSAEIINNGNMLPIDDSLVTGPSVTDTRVLKASFNVSGVSSNPDNTIYDIALHDTEIDCDLRTEELKWRLYKNDSLLSEGNLSPTFDAMAGNRLVLTNTQEDLTTSTDKYTFLLWISESCTGDIKECTNEQDQSKYLNKKFNSTIKVELSTKSKKTLNRITSSADSCGYVETAVPICNNLTYNGSSQTLVNTGSNYVLNNNIGTNAGSYTVTLKLNKGYKWNDGSTNDKAVSCNIAKANMSVTTLDQTITYGDKISNSINDVRSSSLLANDTLKSVFLTASIADVGTGTISGSNTKIVNSLSEDVTSNYNITYNNTGKVIINCSNTAVEPTINDVIYDGTLKVGVSGGEHVEILGTKEGKDVGEYKASSMPIRNYCWNDKTTVKKDYIWNITSSTYMIKFDSNGGTGTMNNQTASYDKTVTLSSNTYTKAGYTFAGWNTKADGTGTNYSNNQSVKNLAGQSGTTITLYAKWTIATYTLNYNSNGGSSITSKKLNYGATYGTLPTPTRTGYTLNGWYTSASGGTKVSDTTAMGAEDTTIYAQWKANVYNVAYNANGGTGTMTSSSHTYDIAKTLTSNVFTRAGYTFTGWNTKSDGTGTAYANSVSVKNLTSTSGGIFTLYAQWKANTYTVKLDPNGGTVSSGTKSVTYNSTYGTLPNPTRTGYTFDGWYNVTDSKTFSLKTSTSNYYYFNTLSNIYPGVTYTVSIDSATVTSGTATEFSTKIYDFTTNTTLASAEQSFGTGISYNITCPSTADPTHDIKLIIYSGPAGSTSGIATTYTNVRIGTNGSTTSIKYSASSTVSVAGNHTLYAKWKDSTAPSTPTYKATFADGSGTYTSGSLTNKRVITTISSTDSGSGVKEIQRLFTTYADDWKKLSFGESALTQNGTTWTGTESWTVSDNRNDTVKFRAVDNAGNISGETSFTIKYKTTNILTASKSSMSLAMGSSGTYTYTYVGDGAITCSSSNSSVATCSVNTSTKTVTVTTKGVGSATIKVNASAGKNFTAQSVSTTVTSTGTPVNANRFYSYTATENGSSVNRTAVYYVTACANGTCAYSMLNGLTKDYDFSLDVNYPITWLVAENKLTNTVDTSYGAVYNASLYLNCYEGANTNTTIQRGWPTGTQVRLNRTTTQYNTSGVNWWYSTTYDCYVIGNISLASASAPVTLGPDMNACYTTSDCTSSKYSADNTRCSNGQCQYRTDENSPWSIS